MLLLLGNYHKNEIPLLFFPRIDVLPQVRTSSDSNWLRAKNTLLNSKTLLAQIKEKG